MKSLGALPILLGFLALQGLAAIEFAIGGGQAFVPRLSEVLAGLGPLAAALSFDREDPPRRAWMILGVALSLVSLSRVIGYFGVGFGGVSGKLITVIISNILCVIGMFTLSRVLRGSGLTPEWTEHTGLRNAIIGIVILLTGASGYVFYELFAPGLPSDISGIINATATVISTIGDLLICSIGLFLVWLVRPMMGGSVAQPFLLVAAGGGVFIVVDVLTVLQRVTTSDQFTSPLHIGMAIFAWTAFALGGFAQLRVLRSGER